MIRRTRRFFQPAMSKEYLEISARKIKERDAKIPPVWRLKNCPTSGNLLNEIKTCGILTDRELDITSNYDVVELSEKLSKGDFSAEEVTVAFCKRTAVAQQLLNCVTEILFDDAIKTAQNQDDIFRKTGRVVGPFHGIPMSVKDSYNIAGVDSSIGVTSNAFKPETENSGIVDALNKCGAIIICKTNVPQSMMVLDTDNFTFGRTRNPHSEYMTAAGSSGGAGALVAFRGTLIGWATDIGGSIRVPAYANGVYGFKPSSGRLPYYNIKGYWAPGEDYNGVLCVTGPCAVSMRDCEFVIRAICETEPWTYDPTCVYSPWSLQKKKGKLTIGLFDADTYEPITSILKETVERLKNDGHEIIKMNHLLFTELKDLARDFFQVDGGDFLVSTTAKTGEPLTPTVIANGVYPCPKSSLIDFFAYTDQRIKYQKAWLDFWKESKKLTKNGRQVDLLLMPVLQGLPRVKEYSGSYYVYPWNTLDYPALVFPARKVDATKDSIELPPSVSKAEQDAARMYPSSFSTDIYDEFPVGLQLVGRRLQDAELLDNYKIIADCLGTK